MSGCQKCCGSCGSCGEVVLSPGEVGLLRQLAQIPFLPVARRPEDITPVYLEDPCVSQEEAALLLQCLEKRGLIRLDYDKPLKGHSYSAYAAFPLHGSFALTEKGQQLLDLMDLQGLEEI